MNKLFRILRHTLGVIRNVLLKKITGLVPKDRNLILFSAWFGEKYADSSMYLFEYLLKKSKYKIYWFSKNKDLYEDLKRRNIPVLYSKTIRAKWFQSRAIMLLSSVQTSDYNPFFLNKCIFLDLDHGFPGKPVGLAQPNVTKQWADWYHYRMEGLDFYQTAASKFAAEMQCKCYDLDYDHQIFANKPRIDVLFNKELWEGKNTIIDKLKKGHKIISYLPTHRVCGKKTISIPDIFDLPFIQSVCENNNAYFIIKKHFYHRQEIEDLSDYPNIFDFTIESLDTQVLLAQSDVLITDFSSCFNDYLALDRPIIFYAFDYNDYLANDRDYYWKYERITSGYTAKNKEQFNQVFDLLSNDWNDKIHEEGRKEMRRVYFDEEVEMGTSREKLGLIIDQLISGTYVPYDWKIS